MFLTMVGFDVRVVFVCCINGHSVFVLFDGRVVLSVAKLNGCCEYC